MRLAPARRFPLCPFPASTGRRASESMCVFLPHTKAPVGKPGVGASCGTLVELVQHQKEALCRLKAPLRRYSGKQLLSGV